jgi:Sec-independent protein translocase protein TatA
MRLLIATLLVLTLVGCAGPGRFEKAGANADKAVRNVKNGVGDVVDDVRDGAKEVRDDVKRNSKR